MDEIGDMTPLTQTKVLRVLQDQQFERVGGAESIRTDVRLIAATNRNLEAMIERGDFRGDLFYRLNVYTITLPPLRDRGDDVELLAEHFCRLFAQELGKEITGIAPETVDRLKAYLWPGNVRELQSVIKHALLESTGPVLVPAFLPESVRGSKRRLESQDLDDDRSEPTPMQPGTPPAVSHHAASSHATTHWSQFVEERLIAGSESIYDEAQQLMDRHLIPLVLQHANGNQLQAAKLLGVSRATLRTKCRQYGITVDKVVDVGDS